MTSNVKPRLHVLTLLYNTCWFNNVGTWSRHVTWRLSNIFGKNDVWSKSKHSSKKMLVKHRLHVLTLLNQQMLLVSQHETNYIRFCCFCYDQCHAKLLHLGKFNLLPEGQTLISCDYLLPDQVWRSGRVVSGRFQIFLNLSWTVLTFLLT